MLKVRYQNVYEDVRVSPLWHQKEDEDDGCQYDDEEVSDESRLA